MIVLTVVLALGLAGPAGAAFVDFEDGVQGSAIGGFYAGLGLTFSNAKWNDSFGLAGSSGDLALAAISDPFNPSPAIPIVGTFASAQTRVSITAADVGVDGAALVGYNDSGVEIARHEFYGEGAGVGAFTTLSIFAGGIAYFELFQPLDIMGGGDGLIWDDLSFSGAPVPLPGAVWLLGSGLVGLAGLRKKLLA